MESPLEKAIIEFLANEFKLKSESINPDTSFTIDLGLTSSQLQDLLQRLQDSLNIILPEEKITQIDTISDLLEATQEDNESPI